MASWRDAATLMPLRPRFVRNEVLMFAPFS